MVKIKFAALAVAILAAVAGSASAQQPASPASLPDGKIAVINTTIFPEQIAELKQKYSQVETQFKDRFQQLQTLDNELKQMENELRTKAPAYTAEKLQEMQATYETKKKRGSRDFEDFKSDYDRAVEAATKPVRDKLLQFMQTYAGQRGIVMIINLAGAAQTGSLAYWNPSADVTQDFISEYNKANPVPGAAAPAPRPAASQPQQQTPAKPAAGKP
jgi:Skp family chaperone for outer membrane proteins